jgi:hypothetical protein
MLIAAGTNRRRFAVGMMPETKGKVIGRWSGMGTKC